MTKTKSAKCLISLLLVTILAFSLVIPACAVDTPALWRGRVANFPLTAQASYNRGLAGIIQRVMYCYNDTTRAYIVNSGGIDATFGNGTKNALKHFQVGEGLAVSFEKADAMAGNQTWTAIGDTLGVYLMNGFWTEMRSISPCDYTGLNVILAQYLDSSIRYQFYKENNVNCDNQNFYVGPM